VQDLFKYCRPFITDILPLFNLLAPLFSHPQMHIRVFSAESFGVLLRKHFSAGVYTHLLTSCLDASVDYRQTIALLLFESLKQINFTFSSKVTLMLDTLLDTFVTYTEEQKEEQFVVLDAMFVLVGNYTDAENLKDLWQVLFTKLPCLDHYLLDLASTWTGLQAGTRIHGTFLLTQIVAKFTLS
jgi:hypothetical protein